MLITVPLEHSPLCTLLGTRYPQAIHVTRLCAAGQLVLKIPWKQLYTAPVVVLVERLHLLAVPSQDVQYNRQREEDTARDLKRQLVGRYEQTQQLQNSESCRCPDEVVGSPSLACFKIILDK